MGPSPAVAVASAAVVALTVANRVLYKPAFVPLKAYPFLAQLTTFGVGDLNMAGALPCTSILYARYRAGVVTLDMLAPAQAPVRRHRLARGSRSRLRHVRGSYVAWVCYSYTVPVFPGVAAIFSAVLLGRTYSLRQIIGCFLVTYGVTLAVASGANEGQLLSGVKLIWPALMVALSAFKPVHLF